MEREDVLAFVNRDWEAARKLKEDHWVGSKRGLTPREILKQGEDLWRHTRTVRPEGPSEAERQADLENHARVSRLLRSVAPEKPSSA